MSLMKSTFFLSDEPPCCSCVLRVNGRIDALTGKSNPNGAGLEATREKQAIAAIASSFMLFNLTIQFLQPGRFAFMSDACAPFAALAGSTRNAQQISSPGRCTHATVWNE